MASKPVPAPANDADGRPEPGSRWNGLLALVAIASVEVIVGTAVLRATAPPSPTGLHAAPAVPDADALARWAAASGDAGHRPFVIVDKANARVLAYEASGVLRGSSPALLGEARGDDSVPGIGTKPVADVQPAERITPAGRFIARPGLNADGEDVVWVDYEAAVSMHRVRTTQASERRLERLASPGTADNRISYGCINLPAAFYDEVISPLAKAAPTVVYVLPETRPLEAVFAAYAAYAAYAGRARAS